MTYRKIFAFMGCTTAALALMLLCLHLLASRHVLAAKPTAMKAVCLRSMT